MKNVLQIYSHAGNDPPNCLFFSKSSYQSIWYCSGPTLYILPAVLDLTRPSLCSDNTSVGCPSLLTPEPLTQLAKPARYIKIRLYSIGAIP